MVCPPFPKKEYDVRHKRARGLMDEKKLDALLATDVINYTYMGGTRDSRLDSLESQTVYTYFAKKR
jgi:Xaa-Pro aminopeptidase